MLFPFFNSCCTQTPPCPRPDPCTNPVPSPQYIRGSIGPRGADAPRDALYAYSTSQSVDAGAIILLTTTQSTPSTSIALSNNTLTLPVGTYLVSFGATGIATSADAISLGVQLYINNTASTPDNLLAYSLTATNANLSKTIVLNVTSPTTLSLHNSSSVSSTYDNAYITVLKIA